jgi:hypothetical protein
VIRTTIASPVLGWLLAAAAALVAGDALAVPDDAVADANGPGAERVQNGLLALYTFDEPGGGVAHSDVRSEPLDLRIEGASPATWQGGALQFTGGGLLRSSQPPKRLYDAVRASGAFTVELWLKSERTDQQGPARIFSLSANPSQRNLTIGQQADALEVRLRTTQTDANGQPATATAAGSLSTAWMHVVVCRDAEGLLRIDVDGREVARKTVPGDFSNWDDNFPLLLGNESTGDRPWHGRLALLAVYDRALTSAEARRNFDAGAEVRSRLIDLLPPPVDRAIDFVADVQPLLREKCFECHAAGNEEGGLNLAIRARVLEGGKSGAAIRPGNSLHSSLIHLVAGVDPARAMPPDGDPLSPLQIGVLRAWIDQGAPWPPGADVADPKLERAREHWAFQRLREPSPPEPADADNWVRTSVDRFVLARLQQQQLHPSPPLEPRALLRRLYFDLVGLPPTPQQVDGFLASYDPNAEHPLDDVLDQLLSSQHYGERWARHWLDAARFAESDGQESDTDRPTAYRYRDFVIRALNDDMPYDQFVRWQIAGDEIQPDNPDAIIATGFLTAGTHSALGEQFLEEEKLFNRYNELDDVLSTIGSSMLGLTIACARCHDHKYDALSAREYYRLLAAFHSGSRHEGQLPDGSKGLYYRDFDAQPRTTWLFRRADFYDRELEVQLGFPAMLSAGRDAADYWDAARQAVAGQTNSGQSNTGNSGVGQSSTLQRRALADWLTDVDHGAGPLLARVIVNRVWQHHFGYGLVRTEGDLGVRGEPPSDPELLEFLTADFVRHGWSLKRLHRLVLRSAVWRQGAGQPLPVDGTAVDGTAVDGTAVDGTAVDGTAVDAKAVDAKAVDPDNRWLWRMPPRRLDAEVLRDSMLAVSGTLNLEPYGPSFKPWIPPEANLARNLKGEKYPTDAKDDSSTRRRSVYMFHKRLLPYPLLQAFDRPDLLVSCTRRQNTTVAPQALAMLNDRFVRSCAGSFAERLQQEVGDDPQAMVQRSFLLALARPPQEPEAEAAVQFILSRSAARQQRGDAEPLREAVTDYCQTLLCLNEFLYTD